MSGKKRKIALLSIGILLLITLVIGASYALWSQNLVQEGVNRVETDCFKLEFTDNNAIHLENSYPLLDKEGLETLPYTFKITNVCNSSATYQVNLETMEVNGNKLSDKYLKINLQDGTISKITTKLDKEANSKLETTTTIPGAIEAYKLVTGILEPNEEKTYNLRVWMDSEVTKEDEGSMNTSYHGKISITGEYYVDKRGTLATIASEYATNAFFAYKENITKIVFEDTLNPKNTDLFWDLSSVNDGSVMTYLVPNEEDETKYTLYIQSNGGVKASPDMSYFFKDFVNLIEIERLDLLDTKNTVGMAAMFYDCKSLKSLDVSHFDTSKVISMASMFYNCSSLTSLDLSNFDTSNVEWMTNMFTMCRSLTNLNVSHFNTSKIKSMYYMFSSCNNLTNLDLSSFDTSNVTNISAAFIYCNKLVNLDIRNFDVSKVTNSSNLFRDLPATTIVKVKDEAMQSWVLNLTSPARPSSWTENNITIPS